MVRKIIKALARDWAKKRVSIGHYFGRGMTRGPYSHEPARLEVILLGMKGLGKPGVHQEGGTEIHMIWTDTPCRITCWNCGNDVAETMRNPKIECIVAQHPWLENDVLFADIILPVNTTFEVNDIVPCLRDGDSFQTVLLMNKAIEPIGESKSDYEAVCEVAKKLMLQEERLERN